MFFHTRGRDSAERKSVGLLASSSARLLEANRCFPFGSEALPESPAMSEMSGSLSGPLDPGWLSSPAPSSLLTSCLHSANYSSLDCKTHVMLPKCQE